MKQSFLILTILISFYCSAQSETESKKFDLKSYIGFACSATGSKTKAVKTFSSLVKEKKFSKIKKKLFSENNGDKFLSAVICERLEMKNLIVLNENEKKQIAKIKQSKEEITICSGCLYQDKISIKELFEKSEKNILSSEIENWLTKII